MPTSRPPIPRLALRVPDEAAAALGVSARRVIDPEDVAAMCGMTARWVKDKSRQTGPGRMPGFKLGKFWKYRREDVERWIDEQAVQAGGTK